MKTCSGNKPSKFPVMPFPSVYVPRGANQERYVQSLKHTNTSIVLGTGPAGCGKTLFACCAAAESYLRGDIKKIVITRPTISVEQEELGFLPGSIERKMDPWLQPMYDIFIEYFKKKPMELMIEQGTLEISPLGFMRGRTFKECFILADEMQNSSPQQMLMLMTRIGEGSKMVIMGDTQQSDYTTKTNMPNGLADFLQRYRTSPATVVPYIDWTEMTMDDVERSPVVRQILQLYDRDEKTDISKVRGSDPSLYQKNNIETTYQKTEGLGVRSHLRKTDKSFTEMDAALIPLSQMPKYRDRDDVPENRRFGGSEPSPETRPNGRVTGDDIL
jgi:phosphate starvation-inducible PhoH-like protein